MWKVPKAKWKVHGKTEVKYCEGNPLSLGVLADFAKCENS